MKLTLPFPPSMNHYWRRCGHIMHISEAGKRFRKDVQAVVGLRPRTISGRVSVSVTVFAPDRRVRDIDNLLKPMLDALTHSGIWLDDGQVDDLRIVRGPVEKPGRVEVLIETI